MNPEFTITPVPEELKRKMTGISYPADDCDAQISWEELSYLRVLHVDFDGETQIGELVCNRKIAQDLLEIFAALYEAKYPIEKIRLIDEYGGQDEPSMEDNNSSAFNYRVIYNTNRLSNHALGLAVDINPFYNPYISVHDGKEVIQPTGSEPYCDRTIDCPYMIMRGDLCFRLFDERGFHWGGDWEGKKDYQHFDKI